jgi:hypothetical protein
VDAVFAKAKQRRSPLVLASLQRVNVRHRVDRCYGVTDENVDVYQQSVKRVALSSLQGINGTVFMYGQTGSGKTFTMMGSAHEPESMTERELTSQDETSSENQSGTESLVSCDRLKTSICDYSRGSFSHKFSKMSSPSPSVRRSHANVSGQLKKSQIPFTELDPRTLIPKHPSQPQAMKGLTITLENVKGTNGLTSPKMRIIAPTNTTAATLPDSEMSIANPGILILSLQDLFVEMEKVRANIMGILMKCSKKIDSSC